MSDAPASGAEVFVRNLLDICRDRQAAKLAQLRTAGGIVLTLEPFEVFNNSARLNQKWPALTIAPVTEDDPLAESGQFRGDIIELVASVEVIHPLTTEGNEIGYKLMRRARAVRAMIREATPAEVGKGLEERWLRMLEWDVSRILYTTLQKREEQLMKLAQMAVTVKVMQEP